MEAPRILGFVALLLGNICSVVGTAGGWSAWSQWSTCTSPYDVRIRTRECSHPPPSEFGEDCVGLHTSTSDCADVVPSVVPGTWDTWSAWEPCSVSCGPGTQQRTRRCQKPPTFTCKMCTPFCGGISSMIKSCSTPCPAVFRDCTEIKGANATATSGVYRIRLPILNKEMDVFCNMSGSQGETYIQRRLDGSVDFYKTFAEYKNGFGTASGEYWLGLDAIHELTLNQRRTLKISLGTKNHQYIEDTYDNFLVGQGPNYTLSVGTQSNPSGALRSNSGCKFSAYDNDQDQNPLNNCAESYHGAWWFETCGKTDLNGPYFGDSSKIVYFSRFLFTGLKVSHMGII